MEVGLEFAFRSRDLRRRFWSWEAKVDVKKGRDWLIVVDDVSVDDSDDVLYREKEEKEEREDVEKCDDDDMPLLEVWLFVLLLDLLRIASRSFA
mmetsp:Transcript_22511/g.27593  ORF Transcript_22511/g.27593 Transcript_22511/m.27593 type:complete len:94 (+) Transcript_22511:318-599(+)